MNRRFALLGAAAALAFAASSHAQQIAKPLSSLAGSTTQGKVSCHGVPSVPMTLDAEQTLPMQVIAKLNCGESLALLSDPDAYTVNVRTADGKIGYIARMYVILDPNAASSEQLPSAAVQSGVARWQPGAAGSDQFTDGDSVIESLTVNGVTVQVSLHDTGWKLRANVLVSNSSSQHLYINPARFTLVETAPFNKVLSHEDSRQIVNAATHQVLWNSANAYAPEGRWNQSSQTNTPAAMNIGYKVPAPAGNSKAMFSRTQNATDAKEIVMHEGKIEANDKTEGAVWFERDKKAQHLLLRVPVDGVIYEFPLSFNHDK
jgi:hypothetical protein